MASEPSKPPTQFYAIINYEDPYVEPLIHSALKTRLPESAYQLISSLSDLPSPSVPLLQFRQYESLDFPHLVSHPSTSLANAYVIRRALTRKHYLSTTVSAWVTKYPDSLLKKHVKPSVEFEVDYAEFLDDALVEAWELKESWERGRDVEDEGGKWREWWILKPGMSERGHGIRLFSSEEELVRIFEGWDPESDDEDEVDDDDDEDKAEEKGGERIERTEPSLSNSSNPPTGANSKHDQPSESHDIITSHIRHFIAQPYIHPPLLLFPPASRTEHTRNPSRDTSELRKFHIRTYVLAVGALKVYVYKPMLALFAAQPYTPPWASNLESNVSEALKAHLTNTCLQDTSEREGSVALFWALPDTLPAQPYSSSAPADDDDTGVTNWKQHAFSQICAITGEVFEAAARGMSIHFQALPNAFEVFGVDVMVSVEADGELRTWLLEVNAFPDFRQTGDELKGVVAGLFKGAVDMGIAPFFGVEGCGDESGGSGEMVKVLDIDLGRR